MVRLEMVILPHMCIRKYLILVNQVDILGGTKPQITSRPSVLPDGLTWETSTTTQCWSGYCNGIRQINICW